MRKLETEVTGGIIGRNFKFWESGAISDSGYKYWIENAGMAILFCE